MCWAMAERDSASTTLKLVAETPSSHTEVIRNRGIRLTPFLRCDLRNKRGPQSSGRCSPADDAHVGAPLGELKLLPRNPLRVNHFTPPMGRCSQGSRTVHRLPEMNPAMPHRHRPKPPRHDPK